MADAVSGQTKKKRFRLGFSFAGEVRDFVQRTAETLALRFGEAAILYDRYHEAEFARRDLGIYLPELYHNQTDLVIVVVCPDYDRKQWTGLEWTAIHDLLSHRDQEVLLCRFGLATVKGLYSTAGYVDLGGKMPEQLAKIILQRLALNDGLGRDAYLEPSERPQESESGQVEDYHDPAGNVVTAADSYFPQLDSVEDSLGNKWKTGTPKYIHSHKVLRVGDVLEFVVSGHDPTGAELEYSYAFHPGPSGAWTTEKIIRHAVSSNDVGRHKEVLVKLRIRRSSHGHGTFDDAIVFVYVILPNSPATERATVSNARQPSIESEAELGSQRRERARAISDLVDRGEERITKDKLLYSLFALQRAGVSALETNQEFLDACDALHHRHFPHPLKLFRDLNVDWLQIIRFANDEEISLSSDTAVYECIQLFLSKTVADEASRERKTVHPAKEDPQLAALHSKLTALLEKRERIRDVPNTAGFDMDAARRRNERFIAEVRSEIQRLEEGLLEHERNPKSTVS